MEENTTTTNEATGETPPINKEPLKTVQFTARVFGPDKTFVTDLIKNLSPDNVALGFSAIVKRLQVENNVPVVQTTTENTFELKPNQRIVEFQPELLLLLTKIRRFLKSKGKINGEDTEQEFLEAFLQHAMKTYIDRNYSHLV